MPDFASTLVAWQRRHGRHDLPWQRTRDPYRIWLAEVMLQQTQVSTATPYYERFLRRFPGVESLAAASEEEVLRLWSGLGYYARGRNLHRAAREIVERHGGRFPRQPESLAALPGVGRSTAAAIAAFAFGKRAAILDGNARRVLARCFAAEGEKDLWRLAERLLPKRNIESYTQALMDLGATICTRLAPRCDACPVLKRCVALRQGRISALPAPRARRPRPLRSVTWLVLLRGAQVLLERRPGAGLWGGLWAFPEAERKHVAAHCRNVLGCELAGTRELEPFEHGFSHFRLSVQPVLCEVARATPRAEAPGRLWVDLADAGEAAVPQPVKKLLVGLSGAQGS